MEEYRIESTEHGRILILTDLHYCASLWHHTTSDERMELLVSAVNEEYRKNPYDGILCLGDYSLDFWMWGTKGSYLGTPSVSNTRYFMEKVLPRFPMKPYLIPGNHEQYGEEKWKSLTGYHRQMRVFYGEYLFLLCDTFHGNLDPKEHSDGTYTGVNPEILRDTVERYGNYKIILCLHDLIPEKEGEETKKLIRENENILCAFAGHTHESNTVLLDESFRHLPVFYSGDFSYSSGVPMDGKPNWGYRTLDLKNGFSTKYHSYILEH